MYQLFTELTLFFGFIIAIINIYVLANVDFFRGLYITLYKFSKIKNPEDKMSAMVEIHETYNTTYPTLFSYFKIGQLIFQAMLIFTPALPIALILLIKPVFLNIKWLFTIGIISEILLTGLAIYYHITNLI